VIVDPGHGGKDSGAVHGGVREDAVNLAVAYALARDLRKAGYRVALTRDGDCRPLWVRRVRPDAIRVGRPLSSCRQNLRDRVLEAAAKGESVFLSLHCDHYADTSVRGPRTYYGRGSALQRALAERIQDQLDAFRGRPFTPVESDHFVLVSQPNVPAVTIEVGFLTNPGERALLGTVAYREELARAIVRGLDAFRRDHALTPPPRVDRTLVAERWRKRHPGHHRAGKTGGAMPTAASRPMGGDLARTARRSGPALRPVRKAPVVGGGPGDLAQQGVSGRSSVPR
jgi:N-acetylmuramoyl-L-alanine amidase